VVSVRVIRYLVVAWTLTLCGACQNIGPIAIDEGRSRYNHSIQNTAKDQTFVNIIRVYRHEPITFMDVTEVDASTTLSGTASGAVTNIGAKAGTSGGTLAGQVGSVAGGVTYAETPLIRYQPLLGQALVGQLATPVGPEQLAALYNSNWGIAPLLDLPLAFMTLDQDESFAALNIIAKLDSDAAITLAADKSELTTKDDKKAISLQKSQSKSQSANVTLEVTNKPATTGAKDALVVYLLPFHPHATRDRRSFEDERHNLQLWVRLLWIYSGSQQYSVNSRCRKLTTSYLEFLDRSLQTYSKKLALEKVRDCLPTSIELRTLPAPGGKDANLIYRAPVMRTYSALGILKNATEQPYPKFAFVSPEEYQQIRDLQWNRRHPGDMLSFYTLSEEHRGDISPSDEKSNAKFPEVERNVRNWITHSHQNDDLLLYDPRIFQANDFIRGNRRLGEHRRYILIVTDSHPPINAYVAQLYQSKWYYIDGDDEISQRNFQLISLFMTIMAVPPSSPPLTPAISVGGGG